MRGEMGKFDPSKATETSLDRTDEDGEPLLQRRTTTKHWQQKAVTNLTGLPRNPRELTGELMTESKKKYISKSFIQRNAAMLRVLSRHTSGQRESFDIAAQFEAVQYIRQTAET